MCLGWKKMKNCGRDETVVPPGTTCVDISWFWLSAVVAFGLALVKKK